MPPQIALSSSRSQYICLGSIVLRVHEFIGLPEARLRLGKLHPLLTKALPSGCLSSISEYAFSGPSLMAATAFFTMATASSLVNGSAAKAPKLSVAMAAIARPALMRNALLIVLIIVCSRVTGARSEARKANKIPAFDPRSAGLSRRLGGTVSPESED